MRRVTSFYSISVLFLSINFHRRHSIKLVKQESNRKVRWRTSLFTSGSFYIFIPVRGFLCADSHTLNEPHRFLRNLIEPAVDQQWSTGGALLSRYDVLDPDSRTSSRTWPEIIPSWYHVRFIPGDLVHRALPSFPSPADSKMPVLQGSCSRRYPILALLLLSPFIYRFFPSGCQAIANRVTATTFVTPYFCRPKRGKFCVFL